MNNDVFGREIYKFALEAIENNGAFSDLTNGIRKIADNDFGFGAKSNISLKSKFEKYPYSKYSNLDAQKIGYLYAGIIASRVNYPEFSENKYNSSAEHEHALLLSLEILNKGGFKLNGKSCQDLYELGNRITPKKNITYFPQCGLESTTIDYINELVNQSVNVSLNMALGINKTITHTKVQNENDKSFFGRIGNALKGQIKGR